MALQKYIRIFLKDGTEAHPVTEEVYNSASFRNVYSTKIKKAKVIAFDDPYYLVISGLKKEYVDKEIAGMKPEKKEPEIKKFDFNAPLEESPSTTKRAYNRKGTKAVKA